jgi:argininosuccinate lyase
MTDEIYSADRANLMVTAGIPFRDAYKKSVDGSLQNKIDPVQNIKNKKHLGATGNLGLKKAAQKISKFKNSTNSEKSKFLKAINSLLDIK